MTRAIKMIRPYQTEHMLRLGSNNPSLVKIGPHSGDQSLKSHLLISYRAITINVAKIMIDIVQQVQWVQ